MTNISLSILRGMKKFLLLISLILSFIAVSTVFSRLGRVQASSVKVNQNSELENLLPGSDNLYVSKDTIEINKDIKGDLIASGGKIVVNNDVYDDAILVGGTIEINGDIRGNLYCAGGVVTVKGTVRKDVTIFAGTVIIKGIIDDDARIFAGEVTIQKGTEIGGDLIVQAGQGSVSNDVTVDGIQKIDFGERGNASNSLIKTFIGLNNTSITALFISYLRKIAVLIGWLFVGWLLFTFMPVKSRTIVDSITEATNKAQSFFIGCGSILTLIFLIPILILFAIIGIGEPFLKLFTVLFLLGLTVAGIYSSTALTKIVLRKIKKKEYNRYMIPLFLGVSLYSILGWIPCGIGFIVKIVITTWGMGALILTKYHLIKESRAKKKTY
jgi:hypothetical protein